MEYSNTELKRLREARFADPTIDFAFKRIFGSEKYKAATIGLLNSIIKDRRIADISFLNVELQGKTIDSRKSFIDILCKDDSGATFIVEMQKASQKFFKERMIFYTSQLISMQAEVGKRWDYHIQKTYSIAFLNFDIRLLSEDEMNTDRSNDNISEDSEYMLHYKMLNVKTFEQMENAPEYYFVSLENFNKKEEELATDTEKWLFLLQKSKFFSEIPKAFNADNSFVTYLNASERAGFSKEEENNYIWDMMNDWDIENSKLEAVDAALAKGRTEGEAIGLEKGRMEDARNLLALGVDIEIISKATGLSQADILATNQ